MHDLIYAMEFWTSENKLDQADIVVKRCLFTIHNWFYHLIVVQEGFLTLGVLVLFTVLIANLIWIQKMTMSVDEVSRKLEREIKEDVKLSALSTQQRLQRIREAAERKAREEFDIITHFKEKMTSPKKRLK